MKTQIVLFIIDSVLITLAFLLSFVVRYGTNIPEANFAPYRENFAFLTFIYLLSLAFAGLYKIQFRSFWDLFRKIFIGSAVGALLGLTFVYIFRRHWMSFPTSIFIISFLLAVLMIFLVNAWLLKRNGRIIKKIVIVGEQNFEDDVLENSKYIEKICINRIEDLISLEDIDEIRICEILKDNTQLNLMIYFLRNLKIEVTFSPSIYHQLVQNAIVGNESIMFLKTFVGGKSDGEEFLIACLDIVGSLLLLFLTLPLMIIIAIAIKLTSPGPIFYIQKRFGKDGKPFLLYKFRTMIENAENLSGMKPSEKDDDRITKIGRYLRPTRLDELPQLLNVIKGQMSLVGPRPENISRVETHKALQGIRLAVRPGLTGLAQIRSYYDLHPNHKIKYDYLYIQKRSFLLHLYLMVKTIPIVLLRRGT